ncbi:hypothetical protein NKG05_29445 [Oerskovia sp. M15]
MTGSCPATWCCARPSAGSTRAPPRTAEAWSPVRAYALFHLWTHTAY